MKKITKFLLAAVMTGMAAFAFIGCGGASVKWPWSRPPAIEVPAPEPEPEPEPQTPFMTLSTGPGVADIDAFIEVSEVGRLILTPPRTWNTFSYTLLREETDSVFEPVSKEDIANHVINEDARLVLYGFTITYLQPGTYWFDIGLTEYTVDSDLFGIYQNQLYFRYLQQGAAWIGGTLLRNLFDAEDGGNYISVTPSRTVEAGLKHFFYFGFYFVHPMVYSVPVTKPVVSVSGMDFRLYAYWPPEGI